MKKIVNMILILGIAAIAAGCARTGTGEVKGTSQNTAAGPETPKAEGSGTAAGVAEDKEEIKSEDKPAGGKTSDKAAAEGQADPESAVIPVYDEWDTAFGSQEAYWIAYWDEEDYLSKIMGRQYGADIICIFEAYYDTNASLVYSDAAKAQFDAIKGSEGGKDKKYYLTFVNDMVGEGVSSQKDTDLLYTLLRDPAKHARDIVDLAKAGGYDGVEIDYEKIRNDLGLWSLFINFENELIKLCSQEGLGLRVLLEPSTPVSEIALPAGPEYVVMCYNLYGYGTGPGPKADRDFLNKIVEDFAPLSGNLGYAFANGGFDWDLSKDEILALTDLEGKELLKEYAAEAVRDEKSGVMTFKYEKEGKQHEVWIADDETIKIWTEMIYEFTQKEVRVSLWRI